MFKQSLVILAAIAGVEAFAPAGVAPASRGLALRASSVRKAGLVGPKMMDPSALADGVQLIAAYGVANVPFVDEVTGDGAGFTSPLSHFGSVRIPSQINAISGGTDDADGRKEQGIPKRKVKQSRMSWAQRHA